MITFKQEGFLTKVFLDKKYIGRLYDGNNKYYASRPQRKDDVEFNTLKSAVLYLIMTAKDGEDGTDTSKGS